MNTKDTKRGELILKGYGRTNSGNERVSVKDIFTHFQLTKEVTENTEK